MQTTPQRRQGRGSSGPESLFEVNRRSRKSKSRRSSKAKRRVKSPPDSGTVDSDWYVFLLQSSSLYSPFFLARFGMRELCACSRHVRNLHSACLLHERESHLWGCMLWRHRKSFRSTVRKIEQLLCRSANLSFRPVFVYYRIKKPCETRNQPAGFVFVFRLVMCR